MVTVVELRKEAKAKGIKGYSKMNKAELCKALNKGPSCVKGVRKKSPVKTPKRKQSPKGGMTVKELKEKLKAKGLSTTGNKAVLVKRWEEASKTPRSKSPKSKSSTSKSPRSSPKTKDYSSKLSDLEKAKIFKHPFVVHEDFFKINPDLNTSQQNINDAFKNGDFSNVTSLYLDGHLVVEKTLPNKIEKFTKLENLYLEGYGLKVLPKEIGNLKNLIHLDLGDNYLTNLPDEIGNLKKLKTLDISRNQLKTLPVSLGKLKHLESLDVSDNIVATDINRIPKPLHRLEGLKIWYK